MLITHVHNIVSLEYNDYLNNCIICCQFNQVNIFQDAFSPETSHLGPFNNYVTHRGARGGKQCVTDHSQHNVKKRYEGGIKNLSKKRYVIVEQPF